MNLKPLEKYRNAELESHLSELVFPGESFAAGMIGKVAFTVTIDALGAWMAVLSKKEGVVTQRDARTFFNLVGESHKENEVQTEQLTSRMWEKS